VDERIVALADKLGVAATEIWRIALQQVEVEFWACGGRALLWLGVAVISGVVSMSVVREDGFDHPMSFFGPLVAIGALCLSGYYVEHMIVAAVNPEFMALDWILGELGSLK
jgi:hypothetical protein